MPNSHLQLLIVDDDEGDRKQILRSMRRSGLECEYSEAESIKEALNIFDKKHFDCVILDYMLPGGNGLEGIDAMLQRDTFLPIIMSTGRGSEHIASEAIKRGAMDYIRKADMNAATLRAAVDSVMKRSTLSRKLAEQQSALALFARVLVHDLKAPLQSILGFARLVEVFLRQKNFDREKIITQAQRIADGALRMDALLDELHAYTDADAQPHFENLRLDQLVSDVLANLDAAIGKSGARIVYGDLPVICGDRTQLIQLLQNLIGNGIKYCKAATPEIQVSARERANGGCEIAVRDNGIGIPKEYYKTVFEPFRRLHSQGEYEGTGLGLATCKKIVEQHGGAIWCTSEPGKGTCFFFTVPLVKRSDKTISAPSSDNPPTKH